jgi:hypothetical protein
VANTLSDRAWADICAAAQRTPGPEARAVLSTILFEDYPAFARDRTRWREDAKQAERMLKHLDEFAKLYRQAWLPRLPADELPIILAGRASALTDKRTEADLWCLKVLRRRPDAIWCAAEAVLWANAKRRSSQREWLYTWLYSVWVDDFHAPDFGGYGVPSLGGPPSGPLITFMLAAIGQVVSELPSPETVRDAIERARRTREACRQLSLPLRERDQQREKGKP